MTRTLLLATLASAALAGAAPAADISTHILNIATGEGGGGIPVTLEMEHDGNWTQIGTATTENNGRVEGFGFDAEQAKYRLHFDMTDYEAVGETPFFPEITVTFDVQDTSREHHVPVLVSPYGYSTDLGN